MEAAGLEFHPAHQVEGVTAPGPEIHFWILATASRT